MGRITTERAQWLSRHILPHEPALRAWLGRRMLRLDIEVDDVVQETYAKLAVIDSVAHIVNPKAYLFQVARSILLQEVRRSRIVSIEAMSDMGLLEIAAIAPLADRQVEGQEELRQVAAAIDQLPDKCREVFILRRMHGLSQREIAERLGLSENTVEKHVGRGVRRLADLFGRGGKAGGGASMEEMMDDKHDAGTREQRRN